MGSGLERLVWLLRRLSRMYWQEVPYRAASVVRGLAQSRGLFSAQDVPVPARDAKWGQGWCRVPAHGEPDAAILQAARDVVDGRLTVFGTSVPTMRGIPDWNADPVTGIRIGPSFGLFIDFRHVGRGVDIKHLWEVNRHLWWVPLAQHYALTGDRQSLARIGELLASWLDACPYPLGPNWSSPVEHGIRLINWSAVWTLIGGADSPLFEGVEGERLLERWLRSVYQHVRFASDNYSFFSSADNHLIGEAAGVFVGAHTWDRWDETRALRAAAKRILEQEALKQFSADGVNLEQATCYHKFSLQFLVAAGLCGRANGDDFSKAYWDRVEAAMTFIGATMDCAGNMPGFGDADDGEVWSFAHGADSDSYRSLLAAGAALFARADLQAKVQSVDAQPDRQLPWLRCPPSPPASAADLARLPRRFESGGYAILGDALHSPNELRLTFDCGPLGYNRIAGHGHADALSVLVSCGGEPLLVDAGTYCYNAEPDFRHYFRGTHAHNTLVVDDKDQSDYGASFLWLRDVRTSLHHEGSAADESLHASHDGYARLPDPVVHHRRVSNDPMRRTLVVEDWLECGRAHQVELLWHAAPGALLRRDENGAWELSTDRQVLQLTIEPAAHAAEVIEGRQDPPQGWVSQRFYERTPAPVLSARTTLEPRQVLRTTLRIGAGSSVGEGATA